VNSAVIIMAVQDGEFLEDMIILVVTVVVCGKVINCLGRPGT
jgi:hypothetical protein